MVTGVETAGLVLGAIPLIISALEHYDDFAAPTKAFIHWKQNLQRLIQELYVIHVSYDQAIRLLLKPFARLEDQITMVEDPRSDLWTKGDIADNLRDKLGLVYSPFIFTVNEVSEILVEIASCLNIPGSQQVITNRSLLPIVISNSPIANTSSPHNNFEFRQKIKFTMKRKRVKSALERLEVCTGRIDTWVTRADKLQDETSQSRLKLKFSASLGTIQENAARIYRAISRHWCTDQPVHVACLLLEQRLVRPNNVKRRPQTASLNLVAQATCFGLSLHGECCPSSQWLNSEIRIDELPPRSSSRTVRVTVSVREDDYDRANLQHITNVCNIIRQPAYPFVGFCLDDVGCLKSYASLRAATEHVQQSLTLEALLPHFKEKLPIAEVYGLAITLVSSIFQLSHTPWLDTKWNKKNILFSRAGNSLSLTVDLRYPYLAKHFYSGDGTQRPSGAAVNRNCSNLLALAIMLLEINSGRPFEQRRGNEQITTILPNDQSDLHLADGWLKEEKFHGRLSCGFSQAILTCLQEYLNPDTNFNDNGYCDALKEKVLLPLEEEMEYLLNRPPSNFQ